MASTSLTRTFGQTGNRTTMTFSAWVKKAGLGSNQMLLTSSYQGNSAYQSIIFFDSEDRLVFKSVDTSTTTMHYVSTRKFKDVNAWYHVVWSFDTTQSTASNRVKLYVNGEQITSFSTETIPSQNADNTWYNITQTHKIGVKAHSASDYFNGAMSHIHFIDGTAYTPSAFGETDSTTGEWKIKTSPSVTYGNNGFFILKDGNSVTDQSGNSNNWTVGGGTFTNTEDCPSNVFATLNPLLVSDNGTSIASKFSNGNTKHTGDSAGWRTSVPTLLPSTGKWYCEVKGTGCMIGMVGEPNISGLVLNHMGNGTYGWGYESSTGRLFNTGSYTDNWGDTYGSSDIMGIAYDADNKKLYMHKNGTYQNSGVPTSGATGTGAISLPNNREYYFAFSPADSTSYYCEVNFGNGYFGTTAVASAGTNASGNGIFEYDVPTGYTALSTKGLNL